MGRDKLRKWYQKSFCKVLADTPPPKLPLPRGPSPWTPAIQELLREAPVLSCEPAVLGTLIGRTVWKFMAGDQQWWRGRITRYSTYTSVLELFPMYHVSTSARCLWTEVVRFALGQKLGRRCVRGPGKK